MSRDKQAETRDIRLLFPFFLLVIKKFKMASKGHQTSGIVSSSYYI